MRIHLASVYVDDQDKALSFYTEVPVGDDRWLTVVSPDAPEGPELLLEPSGHPAVEPFKLALRDDGIPFTSFAVDDVNAEYERLQALGVEFTQKPLETPGATTAFSDTPCGNLTQTASTWGGGVPPRPASTD